MSRSAARPPLPPSAINSYAWQRLRLVILARDGQVCQIPAAYRFPGRAGVCARPANSVDHIIPRSRGGQTIPTNLRAACRPCNTAKGDRLDSELAAGQTSRPRNPRPEHPTPHLRDW